MPRPSFFIVGNPKGGTSALYQFLKAHPAVFMCQPKEPKYFARDFFRTAAAESTVKVQTEAQYLDLFREARPDQRCGEASTWYLYSRVAARAIHTFDPSAKIIVMLREPVDFLYSYYLQLRKSPIREGERIKDFRKALALEPERRQGRKIPRGCLLPEFLYYSERVKYADQLQRFFTHFDRSQVKVILYDDFIRDNERVYHDVLAFLGLDQDFTPVFRPHNKSAVLRSRPLQHLIRQVSFGEGWATPLKPALKRLIPTRLRRALMRQINKQLLFKSKEALAPELVHTLKQQYHGEVVKLDALLACDVLSRWGYEPPAPRNTPEAGQPLRPQAAQGFV